MNLVAVACEIATYAHKNQVDKAGVPYIHHPEAVAAQLTDEKDKIVGWLHDVLEDTDFSPAILREIFSREIMVALTAITRAEGEPWDEYISRVEKNPIAVRVKMADLMHNMQLRRLPVVTDKDWERFEKYRKTYDRLKKVAEGEAE